MDIKIRASNPLWCAIAALTLLLNAGVPAHATNLDSSTGSPSDSAQGESSIDSLLLRLEYLALRMRSIRGVIKQAIVGFLLDAGIEIIERMLKALRDQSPTTDTVPPMHPSLELEAFKKKLAEESRELVEKENQKLREIIREMEDLINEFKRRPPNYRTCGEGRSRRPNGSCRNHRQE